MTEKRKQGFNTIDPEKQKQIASMGGKAAHAKGTAHEFTSEEARKVGRLGGLAKAAKDRLRKAKRAQG